MNSPLPFGGACSLYQGPKMKRERERERETRERERERERNEIIEKKSKRDTEIER